MKRVKTAGGVAIRGSDILLIKKGGKLALAKGHIEDGETEEKAASRELLEETGYVVEIVKKIGSLSRDSKENNGEIVHKDITIFLMSIRGQKDGEIEEEPIWINIDEALNEMLYPEEKAFLSKHLAMPQDHASRLSLQ